MLIYAQPGSGKRASLLTDYTFGVWDDGELVPVAKAYSGLTNEEIAEMDRWIRRHTVERFGPVRHVEPVHVFELGFEAIAPSTRHRSGIAVRFPRMLRWRKDKPASEADTLDTLEALIADRPHRGARYGQPVVEVRCTDGRGARRSRREEGEYRKYRPTSLERRVHRPSNAAGLSPRAS